MNRFDDDTRLLLHHAREEVEQLHHRMVEPEHLFLAFLRASTPAQPQLTEVIPHLNTLRHEVSQGTHAPRVPGLQEAPSLSPAVRRILERAAQLARKQDAHAASARHVLLALLEHGQVQTLLHTANLDARELYAAVQAATESAAEAAPRAALLEVQQGKSLIQLLQETLKNDGIPPDDLTRENLLGLALKDGHAPVLAQLEHLLLHWLGTPALPETEKKQLLHTLIQWAGRSR